MVAYLTSTTGVGLTQSLPERSLAFLLNAITILTTGQVLYYLNSSTLRYVLPVQSLRLLK